MTNNPNDPQSYPGGQQPPMPGGNPAQGGYGAQPPAGYPGQPGGAMNPMGAAAPLATWGKRAQGWLLDYLAPGVVIGIIASLMPGGSSSSSSSPGSVGASYALGTTGTIVQLVLTIAWFGVLAYTSASTGQTWGRKWAKTQLLGENGTPIGFGGTFGRYFAHIVDSIICYIGWLFPLWDQQRQTLADKIMKTRVYDVSAGPAGQPPMGGQAY